jgi:hypothetical protein
LRDPGGVIKMSSALAWRPTTMQIHERVPGDEPRIEALILAESRAKTRDRLRMVLLALRGWEAPQIAAAFTSIRRCVQT